MAKSQTTLRDEKHELTRRALIKWSVAAGAALGVSRAKIFDILEKTSGRQTAFAASENPTTRSVHIIGGNGSQSWFTLFWPQIAIAKANNPAFAWHLPGAAMDYTGTNNPLVYGKDTPWQTLPGAKQVTAFTAGTNLTHTNSPDANESLNGSNIISVASALQSASPSVIPLITVGNANAGTAAGGAAPSNVGSGDGIVSLFNSAASRAGGLLSNTKDAGFYKAYYDAFIQLNRASNRSTTKAAYTTASGAAQFLGTNLSTKLAITPADLTRYGITAGTRANITGIARTLIVTAKSFGLGLTNAVALPYTEEDPHGAFDSGDVKTIPGIMKGMFDAFMADLANTTDAVTGQVLADDTVITFHGDTPKDCRTAAGWPDGTANNSNVIYVYSAGHLFSGWFGGIDVNGKATGFGPDGKPATYVGADTAKIANAAIAYAIAKRDDRATSTFANGITIGGVFGNLKAT
jgi:hypothetical protein